VNEHIRLTKAAIRHAQPTQAQEMVEWQSLTSRRMGAKAAIQRVMQAAAAGELKTVKVARTMGVDVQAR